MEVIFTIGMPKYFERRVRQDKPTENLLSIQNIVIISSSSYAKDVQKLLEHWLSLWCIVLEYFSQVPTYRSYSLAENLKDCYGFAEMESQVVLEFPKQIG